MTDHLRIMYVTHFAGYIREFTPDEVKAATEDFSDKVGKGGFGTVSWNLQAPTSRGEGSECSGLKL